jgi:hypothetical protein
MNDRTNVGGDRCRPAGKPARRPGDTRRRLQALSRLRSTPATPQPMAAASVASSADRRSSSAGRSARRLWRQVNVLHDRSKPMFFMINVSIAVGSPMHPVRPGNAITTIGSSSGI